MRKYIIICSLEKWEKYNCLKIDMCISIISQISETVNIRMSETFYGTLNVLSIYYNFHHTKSYFQIMWPNNNPLYEIVNFWHSILVDLTIVYDKVISKYLTFWPPCSLFILKFTLKHFSAYSFLYRSLDDIVKPN